MPDPTDTILDSGQLNPLQLLAVLRETARNLHRLERITAAARQVLTTLEVLDETYPYEDIECACEPGETLCLRCQLRVVREGIGLLQEVLRV